VGVIQPPMALGPKGVVRPPYLLRLYIYICIVFKGTKALKPS